jgi:hypothetical protein
LHFCSMASLKKAASIKILPGKGNGFPSWYALVFLCRKIQFPLDDFGKYVKTSF